MKKYLLLVMLMLSSFAHADAPITKYQLGGAGGAIFSSGEAACATIKGEYPNTVFLTNGWSGYGCYTGGTGGVLNRKVVPLQQCSDGSAPNTSKPLDQQCAPPPPLCTSGTKSTFDAYTGSGPVGSEKATVNARTSYPKSDGSCNVNVTGIEQCYSQPSVRGQDFFCTFTSTRDGGVTPTGQPVEPQPSLDRSKDKPATTGAQSAGAGKSCPAGTMSLGVDSTGGMICGGAGTSPTIPPKTEVKTPPVTTNNSDGSTTKVETSTRSNSDGSTTTTTTTTVTGANGGTTVTQSTSTSQKPASSGGGAGKNDSTDDKKDDFCVKNPTLNVCKNSEVTGGDCSGGSDNTACTGDAINCAILRQQRKEYCENNAPSAMKTLGEQMLAGNDPEKGNFPTKENARKVNVPELNQNGFLGGGSCFPDFQFHVAGRAFQIPFSKLCEYLIALRGLVMLLAALASWRLVSKSILG